MMTERLGVEIDYCPSCRGIWLDRGELDKIIEKSGLQASGAGKKKDKGHDHDGGYRPSDFVGGHRKYDDDDYYRHKKKSMWKELFDF
jgi:Zn-finger nucleic acid-binding protein